MKNIGVKNEKIDGVGMVRITVGTGEVLLTTDEAYQLSSVIEDVAGFPAFDNHLDEVFENWDSDGGTS